MDRTVTLTRLAAAAALASFASIAQPQDSTGTTKVVCTTEQGQTYPFEFRVPASSLAVLPDGCKIDWTYVPADFIGLQFVAPNPDGTTRVAVGTTDKARMQALTGEWYRKARSVCAMRVVEPPELQETFRLLPDSEDSIMNRFSVAIGSIQCDK